MKEEEKELDFAEDIKTDKHNLDYELVNQPKIHNDWAKAHVQALKEKDKARARIDLVKAEVDEDIRKNWDTKYNMDKRPTEGAISQAIILSKEFQEANNAFIEANSNVKYLDHCMTEFDQKHTNLGGLIKLFLSGYYSESTKIHEDVVEKKLENKTNVKIKEKLSKLNKKEKLEKVNKKKLKKIKKQED